MTNSPTEKLWGQSKAKSIKKSKKDLVKP